jgi:tetratricopeptide (TPR) repeat protein
MPTVSPPSRDAAVEASVFWFRFRKEITAVLIVAILAMAGYTGYGIYSDRRNASGARSLASAKTAQDYQQLIERYPNTPAGASAYILLAETQRKDKKLVEANASLQTFINKYPQHELAATAQMAIATNLESMGKGDEALSKYQQIAASYPKNYIAPFALLAQVELLKTKGRIDEARRVCEQIMTNYRGSIVEGEARQQLRSLRPSGKTESGARSTTVLPTGAQPPAMSARPGSPQPTKAPATVQTPSTAKPK